MHRILIAQLGARRHYAVPRALYRTGLLDTLVTDACADIPPWRWLEKLVPECRRGDRLRRLMGRSVPQVPPNCIAGLPLFALQGLQEPRRGERRTDYWARRNAAFCRAVVRRGFGNADTVYAFNGAALEIFREAKQLGLRTILDQTAAPWRWNARLLREEMKRWPGWEDRPAELDESGILSGREEEEWNLADLILCGSDFCRDALIRSGAPAEKCRICSFPHWETGEVAPRRPVSCARHGPLRVLFVGTLQLRKGVQYLYDALRHGRAEQIHVKLVGPSMLSPKASTELSRFCELAGPVPRPSVSAYYEWADVVVLPTLSEGSANVCREAMVAGVPVITTMAAGSSVRHGVDGLIVKERDAHELGDAIFRLSSESAYRNDLGERARAGVLEALANNTAPTQLSKVIEAL